MHLQCVVLADERYQIGYDEFNQFSVIERIAADHHKKWVIRDVRGQACVICGRKFETIEDLVDQRERDGILTHSRCFVGHLTIKQRDLLGEALMLAGLITEKIKPIPNQYGGAWDTPWYEFAADVNGVRVDFVFGRRKRVYEIRATPRGWFQISDQFKAEDVTKNVLSAHIMIHAWTDGKVKEYFSTIANMEIRQ